MFYYFIYFCVKIYNLMMKYSQPSGVISPMDCVSNVKVLFDGGIDSFSIAEMEWEGTPVHGIRWNVARREWDDADKVNGIKTCLGMPTSRGYSVWFVLPDVFIPYINQIIADEKERLKQSSENSSQL